MTTKKRKTKGSAKRRRCLAGILKASLLLALVLAVAMGGYLLHLNNKVTEKFEGKRFELPARVFARPLELFAGKTLTLENLKYELQLLGYQHSAGNLTPGEYHADGGHVSIYIRAFEFWDEHQPSTLLRLVIKGGAIAELRNEQSQQAVEMVRLDPVEIGGIYPSKNEDRRLVRFDDVPRHLVDALVATEDQRYYLHSGIDFRSILRAAVSTITGRELQGGSTITQQLVKNFYLTPERTLKRKFNEMLMALLLEFHYEKKEILETYLNEVYFGQDGPRAIHGVGLASEFYFAKDVSQLEPHESALLVALLKGPGLYNPRRNPERAKGRRNLVLEITHEQGFLPDWSFKHAVSQPLGVVPQVAKGLSKYPAFVDLVLRQLRRDYDEDDLRTEGLLIYTTLDPIVQNHVETAVSRRLLELERRVGLTENSLQAAMVVISRDTGEVEAIVGDRNAQFEGFNRAVDARRQIGSLFKPVVYLTAFAEPQTYNLLTPLDDSALTVEQPGAAVWEPNNYDMEFRGEVPAWQALANSYNVPTARLGMALGLKEVADTARLLGVTGALPLFPATLLGTAELSVLEVTQMYQTFAAGGFRVPLRAIREVLTREGRPLKRYSIDVKRVVDERAVFMVNKALQWAVSSGTGSALKRFLPEELNIAGKTGTTDDMRDSWFAAFSGDKVAVTWVGNDQNRPIRLSGATGALQVWASAMRGLDLRALDLRKPEGIEEVAVPLERDARVRDSCENAIAVPFYRDYLPDEITDCGGSRTLKSKLRGWWQRLTD